MTNVLNNEIHVSLINKDKSGKKSKPTDILLTLLDD